jgi:hypothetical protein
VKQATVKRPPTRRQTRGQPSPDASDDARDEPSEARRRIADLIEEIAGAGAASVG